jgi:hypothetical protein
MLRGPVAMVDERDVTGHGMTFELLPGCHVATLSRNVGEGSANGGWAANLPRIVYAFEMKPGHSYQVEARYDNPSSPVGRVYILAFEHAPDGRVIRIPSARKSDIEDCRRWAVAQGL